MSQSEKSNQWKRLLRTPRERPSSRRAAEKRDERAPSHVRSQAQDKAS